MEFGLLIRALARHKVIVTVLVLEFAVTLAILSNALSLASARVTVLQTPSGLQEAGLAIAQPGSVGSITSKMDSAAYDAVRTMVLSQPGVASASVIGQAPLSGADRWGGTVSLAPGHGGHPIEVGVYTGDQGMRATLGLSLKTGRWFTAEEMLPAPNFPDISAVHVIVLTDSLARELFGAKQALGSSLYFDGARVTVVGIVSSLSRPGYHGGTLDQDSVVLPMGAPLVMAPILGIRMRDEGQGSADRTNKTLREALNKRTSGMAVWNVESYKVQRDRLFTADRAALGLLGAILLAVIGVAVNGIAASSGYWVQQRVRQTWIRRALGATRGQIVSYFMTENALICGLGVALGIALGLAVNITLINYLHLARMSVLPLIAGGVLAFAIGQCAVLRTAIKIAGK